MSDGSGPDRDADSALVSSSFSLHVLRSDGEVGTGVARGKLWCRERGTRSTSTSTRGARSPAGNLCIRIRRRTRQRKIALSPPASNTRTGHATARTRRPYASCSHAGRPVQTTRGTMLSFLSSRWRLALVGRELRCIGGHGLGVCEAKRTSAGCPHESMCISGRSVTRESDTCTQDAHARAEVLAPPLKLPTSRFAVCLAPALRYAKVMLYASASRASVPCCLAPRLERQAWWRM
jgi:hypothetical protein